MRTLLHQLISHQASILPELPALGCKEVWLSYAQLQQLVEQVTQALLSCGLQTQQRVAIYLPKEIEAVLAMFATSCARGIFVPINPVLKAAQVTHILKDSETSILITNLSRWRTLAEQKPTSVELVVVLDLPEHEQTDRVITWQAFMASGKNQALPVGLETDLAAILYTSGSTGKPKGVVLSQRNMVLGAASVAQYLDSRTTDRMLAALPLSFDYGFSQLSIAFTVGASCYMMELLFPQDIILAVERERINCLALVPPMWIKLARVQWPEKVAKQIRYFTNSGGAMPIPVLQQLQQQLPEAEPYMMYGLTEAFRSCYLPPKDISSKPGSFGKAIPNVELRVINEFGAECRANEAGELVHFGPLVSQGYWNDKEKTLERFKPVPATLPILRQQVGVWSGDIVTRDEEGYFYFVGRNDEMIKTSGYRVSPTELEEVIYQSGLTLEAVVLGVPHPELGQGIVLLVVLDPSKATCVSLIQNLCRSQLPNYMQPKSVIALDTLPRNGNGKIDRKALLSQYQQHFAIKEGSYE